MQQQSEKANRRPGSLSTNLVELQGHTRVRERLAVEACALSPRRARAHRSARYSNVDQKGRRRSCEAEETNPTWQTYCVCENAFTKSSRLKEAIDIRVSNTSRASCCLYHIIPLHRTWDLLKCLSQGPLVSF